MFMSKSAVRLLSAFPLLFVSLSLNVLAQTAPAAPKPLRASEVMALEAGGALGANIAHDIAARGLNFHPDDSFFRLMTKAGAEASVIAALKAAKVNAETAPQPDKQLLEQLSDAATLMKNQQFAEAGSKLSDALDASFARMEVGFVMAELMREARQYVKAAAVYQEILEERPDFAEAHDKLSFIMYKLGEPEDGLREARAALTWNPNDAEAHKNAGLCLEDERKFDASAAELNEALRIKPDYAAVRLDLGILYYDMQSMDQAIAEYKKAIALDPGLALAHYNLGNAYNAKGDATSAIQEFREAKRLDPNDPAARQNLGSVLMGRNPREAIVELRELEQKFPDFEMCHVCLGKGLAWTGDIAGAEAEYRKAAELDPSDPETHSGLAAMREKEKNYDGALEEYRAAEKLGPQEGRAHANVGRMLLAKKDIEGALAEFKQAEELSPSSWQFHELYGQALEAAGQKDLAIAELKEAVSLDPSQGQVQSELGEAYENKGEWASAMEQYRKGALTEGNRMRQIQPGQPIAVFAKDPQKQYKEAQGRFADYLVSLKAAGKKEEAAELEKRVQALDASGSNVEKVQAALQAGDLAMRSQQFEEAEKSYKDAVALAEKLPPGDENLIVALGKLGNAYGMRRDMTGAQEAFHREMTIIEKTQGPASPRMTDPLFYLGSIAAGTGNFTEAESYFSRALDINVKAFGESSSRTSESLRALAGMYMAQRQWEKAEPYLVRAVKAGEAAAGPDDNLTLIPLWGLCDLYDRWGKPEKSQPCWHRATEIMEKQAGENSPQLAQSLANEAGALRKMGRVDEAEKLEQRLGKIQKTAANQ